MMCDFMKKKRAYRVQYESYGMQILDAFMGHTFAYGDIVFVEKN